MSDLVNALRKAHAVSGYSSTLWSKSADEIQTLRARVAELEAVSEQPVKVAEVMNYGGSPFQEQAPDGYWCRGWNACREAMLAAQEPTQ